MHLAPDTDLLSLTHDKPGRALTPCSVPKAACPQNRLQPSCPQSKALCRALHLPRAVFWWGSMKPQLHCRAWALIITKPGGLESFLWSKDNMGIHNIVQKNLSAFTQLGLQIFCGRERKDCFCCSDTTWLCVFLCLFWSIILLPFFLSKCPLRTVSK